MSRHDEMQLVIDNDGDLYRKIENVANGAINFRAASIVSRVSDYGRRLVNAGKFPRWNSVQPDDKVSYLVIAAVYVNKLLEADAISLQTAQSIVAELQEKQPEWARRRLGEIQWEYNTQRAVLVKRQATEQPTEQEITPMPTTNVKIETPVILNGKNVDSYSDDELFTMIADLEAEQERLSAVKHVPEKLRQRIAELEEQIADVVAIIDAR